MADLQRLNALLADISNLSDRAESDWARDRLAEYLSGLEEDIASLRAELAETRGLIAASGITDRR